MPFPEDLNEPLKKVILCADDFGISPSVNKSICYLAEKKRISATSVMVAYNDWSVNGQNLLDFQAHLDIGLHFVLTDTPPLSIVSSVPSIVDKNQCFYKVNKFIRRAWLGKVNKKEVYGELNAQYKEFIEFFGKKPDFIDGHHNVHQYPVIRDEVIRFIKNKDKNGKMYLRNTAYPLAKSIINGADRLKTILISLPGLKFKKMLQRNKISTNETFGGVYDLKKSNNFKKYINIFLDQAGQKNGIIMIHPGRGDHLLLKRDSFNVERENEMNFLLDPAFPEMLKDHRIILTKFI
jgi:chitin disaccharide deacetylase